MAKNKTTATSTDDRSSDLMTEEIMIREIVSEKETYKVVADVVSIQGQNYFRGHEIELIPYSFDAQRLSGIGKIYNVAIGPTTQMRTDMDLELENELLRRQLAEMQALKEPTTGVTNEADTEI